MPPIPEKAKHTTEYSNGAYAGEDEEVEGAYAEGERPESKSSTEQVTSANGDTASMSMGDHDVSFFICILPVSLL